jgi:nucleotide-binding universal stress UspA family protein
MFSKLLVPLDGSTLAERALPYAVRLAGRLEAEILLLQVVELSPLLKGSLLAEASLINSAETYLREVKEVITDLTLPQHLPLERVHLKAITGNPSYEIAEIAASHKVDLIVMTTQGRSGLAHLLMGSTAASVIQHTELPVLVIRPTITTSKPPQALAELMAVPLNSGLEEGWGKMLVTLDGTPQAEAVLEYAITLAQGIDATIHLLQVIPPLVPFSYGDISLRYQQEIKNQTQQLSQEAYQHLKALQTEISQRGLECSCTVRNGEAIGEILKFTEELKPSLLVMATRARGRLGHILLGSVAEEVLRRSQRPVVLLHLPAHLHFETTEGHFIQA